MTDPRPLKGFAALAARNPERMREIASKGGRMAHFRGTGHEWTSETGREAGRKGGRVVSQDLEHMARIGKIGGQNRRRPK